MHIPTTPSHSTPGLSISCHGNNPSPRRTARYTPLALSARSVTDSPDGHGHRRRPFSTWVRRLTNFKSSEGERQKRQKRKKRGHNNPYPQSGHVSDNHGAAIDSEDNANISSAARSYTTGDTGSRTTLEHSDADGFLGPPDTGATSTSGTDQQSFKAPSHGESSLAGTSRTIGGGMDSTRRGDSTFSSPAPSVRSLTTTLTTIQSVAPSNAGNTPTQLNTQSIQFSQPFPTASPASAIPAHLVPGAQPTTYQSATANNLLTDNASILTLASSSKRRRRRSMDTDASVRAMAPSSLWGGSRESLPLSVLSANIDPANPTTPALHGTPRVGVDRNSIYSTTGVPPAVPGDRNSVYAKHGDSASIRSGLLGHARTESYTGPSASTTSPLASPREAQGESSGGDDGSTVTTKDE